jgi:hypothetical protein
MAQLTEEEFKEQLRRQGFSRVFVWQDRASAFYPEHTHDGLTAHIILDGEMTLSMRGVTKTYHVGGAVTFPLAQYTRRGWDLKAAAT